MISEQTSNATTPLYALTGSRFVAAIAIVILHGQLLGYELPVWLDLAQAVSYFFVLSGFILVYRYPALSDRHVVFRFYWARFARIWPVHLFCVGVIIAVTHESLFRLEPVLAWSILPLQVFLLNAWVPLERLVFAFNPPAWSISVELFFYVTYPFLLQRWSKTWRWKMGASLVLLGVLTVTCYFSSIPAAAPPGEEMRVSTLALLFGNPLARLWEFTLGMGTALAWESCRHRRPLSVSGASLIEILLISGIIADLYWSGHQASSWALTFGPGFSWRILTATPIGTGGCFLYALLLLTLSMGSGLIARVLAKPVFVILGESSYSLYLLHTSILLLIAEHPTWLSSWSSGQRILFWFGVILLSSVGLWRLFELPCRQWLLRHVPAAGRSIVAVQPLRHIQSPGPAEATDFFP